MFRLDYIVYTYLKAYFNLKYIYYFLRLYLKFSKHLKYSAGNFTTRWITVF
jgi:hypothetical protein